MCVCLCFWCVNVVLPTCFVLSAINWRCRFFFYSWKWTVVKNCHCGDSQLRCRQVQLCIEEVLFSGWRRCKFKCACPRCHKTSRCIWWPENSIYLQMWVKPLTFNRNCSANLFWFLLCFNKIPVPVSATFSFVSY